ncbi:PTS sugar transporter subunit IIA [Pediococcus pentosaceus]|uniref:PTS sugar transporter subunit IIA n=1 Tax=Pediococcus pentosaceus TaxID=1255 RepID=UPI00104E74E4|nr:PTS sugar transporter subunit IIA [Pediococcus pentosaceus]KAF0521040.1 hypothetical protein GBP32_09625 [Pediococcus pentosaceus]
MTNLITKDQINLNISGASQAEILTKLANWAVELGIAQSADQLVSDYQAREQESTTGFGNGIAIPHAKSTNIQHAAILVARGTLPIEWASLDGLKSIFETDFKRHSEPRLPSTAQINH